MEERPNYWGILPAPVRYAAIPDASKVLYAEVAALCERDGYCTAGNAYLASLYGVDEKTISRRLSALTRGGFIRLEVDQAGGNRRRLWLVDPAGNPVRTSEIMQRPGCITDKPVTTSGQNRHHPSGQNRHPHRTEQDLNRRSKEGRKRGAAAPPAVALDELRAKAAEVETWGLNAGDDGCGTFAVYIGRYVRAYLDQGAVTGSVLAQELELADETLEGLARRYNYATPRPTIRPSVDTLRALRGE